MADILKTIVNEYEQRVRRMPHVPPFSFQRTMLRDDGAPNRLFLMYLFTDYVMAIEFLQKVRLIRSTMLCNNCHLHLRTQVRTPSPLIILRLDVWVIFFLILRSPLIILRLDVWVIFFLILRSPLIILRLDVWVFFFYTTFSTDHLKVRRFSYFFLILRSPLIIFTSHVSATSLPCATSATSNVTSTETAVHSSYASFPPPRFHSVPTSSWYTPPFLAPPTTSSVHSTNPYSPFHYGRRHLVTSSVTNEKHGHSHGNSLDAILVPLL
jgi:hypothetical protein